MEIKPLTQLREMISKALSGLRAANFKDLLFYGLRAAV